MITAKKLTGLALATAAAGLFATAGMAPVAAKEAAQIHCNGVNQCKGQTACQSASNACKGQNSCKGKGWLYMTKAECTAAQAKMKKEMGGMK
ncbi:MAG: BufA2 family periplasmic bufferin-type metallophore [Sulfuricaulis sp.]